MSGTIAVTIYHLEMNAFEQFCPSQRTVADFEIRQATIPSPAFSRFLYASVGGQWKWFERLEWTRDRWLTYLDRPEQETWVGYWRETPAGYFELERQEKGSVEIVYFGLMPDFIGNGLGSLLLSRAVQRAWESGAKRVWVHTCTLDHPHALQNYLSRGFTLFKEVQKDVALPHSPDFIQFDQPMVQVSL